MPGASDVTSQLMVAQIGVDMQRSTRTRQGAPWLETALVICAWGAVRLRDSYLQA